MVVMVALMLPSNGNGYGNNGIDEHNNGGGNCNNDSSNCNHKNNGGDGSINANKQ